MSKEILSRRLRLYLFHNFRRVQCQYNARAFGASTLRTDRQRHEVTHDYEKRVAQLETHKQPSEWYPRISQSRKNLRVGKNELQNFGKRLQNGETDPSAFHPEGYGGMLVGKITSIRTAGSKLVFMDVATESGTVQVVCKLPHLEQLDPATTSESWKAYTKSARKGDYYSVIGHKHVTERGELSLLASELPRLLSPSLHQVPEAYEDTEARARNRHVDMIVNAEAIQTLQMRHEIEAGIQGFFNEREFVKVTTPLLSATAGGAAARPFETVATELSDERVQLRIAPELWLKRLVVGGMPKVYELGPAFRNEGVDATHNPEFNICEFYEAYASLDQLMATTERLICELDAYVESLRELDKFSALSQPTIRPKYTETGGSISEIAQFQRVEFIPTLEEKLGSRLANLESEEAHSQIAALFAEKKISEPVNPTLPRLLDALAAEYLEPISKDQPIFITHHPACMSPLSKHFQCPKTGQIVAARAELFIGGREYANMYEEENSPFEQRRKFEEQLQQRLRDAEAMQLDEGYLRCLEWGLPPTGGWGCGVDRLVMLFSGREKMSDVLAFGSLRNVVGLGKR
ncbi:Lysine--tRNA ligase, mitochondrial [Pseudocercospora fuligena]|uniref:Lysyl-tRNA synthetase n=1 Tax=Pseudocercospora fuligena TaxID=685502 RepID=A0A8H6RKZ0_9PEZI|nr:Lysine--tRNA ligase, mitochondrial [Pseudocercospora fuligena]